MTEANIRALVQTVLMQQMVSNDSFVSQLAVFVYSFLEIEVGADTGTSIDDIHECCLDNYLAFMSDCQ